MWWLGTVHGIQAGTDHEHPMLRVGVLAATNIIAFLTVLPVAANHRRSGVAVAS